MTSKKICIRYKKQKQETVYVSMLFWLLYEVVYRSHERVKFFETLIRHLKILFSLFHRIVIYFHFFFLLKISFLLHWFNWKFRKPSEKNERLLAVNFQWTSVRVRFWSTRVFPWTFHMNSFRPPIFSDTWRLKSII